MLSFKRQNSDVIIRLDYTTPCAGSYYTTFNWGHNDASTASLRADSLNRQLSARLKSIREEAYDQGWRDAKTKKARKTWFSGTW